jgi:hypothetical protein
MLCPLATRNYYKHLLSLAADASKPLTSPNLEKLGQNATEAAPANEAETSTPFLPTVLHRITLHTLSHLVALVLHPTESFPPPNTKLVVIESLNMVLDQDYPRLPYLTGTRTESQKWKASRRYAVLGSLASGLTALAALYNMAVIVTTGCSNRTRFEDGMNAALAPGIGGAEWETGVWNRVAMFHDFAGRFIGVQKFHGKNLQPTNPVGHIGIVTEFEIVDGGQLRHPSNDLQRPDGLVAARSILAASSSPAKSGLKRAYDEVADSDDDEIDEYGWAEADDEAAAIADIIVLGERPVQEARPAEEVEATADQDRPEAPPAEASPSPTV